MTALMFVFIKDLVPSIDLRPAHTQKHISSNSDLLLSLKLNRTSLFIDGVGVPLYSRYAFLYSLSVTEGLPTVIRKLPAATLMELNSINSVRIYSSISSIILNCSSENPIEVSS